MYKTELVKDTARRSRVSQDVARRVLNEALSRIQESLQAGEPVVLSGFGAFGVRTWPGGRVRDFQSGTWKRVGPRPLVAFRAGQVTRRLLTSAKTKAKRRRWWQRGGGHGRAA